MFHIFNTSLWVRIDRNWHQKYQMCSNQFYNRFSAGDKGEEWKMIAKGNPNWPQVWSKLFLFFCWNIFWERKELRKNCCKKVTLTGPRFGISWSLWIQKQFMWKFQAFYPMKTELVVNPGDILAARYAYMITLYERPRGMWYALKREKFCELPADLLGNINSSCCMVCCMSSDGHELFKDWDWITDAPTTQLDTRLLRELDQQGATRCATCISCTTPCQPRYNIQL